MVTDTHPKNPRNALTRAAHDPRRTRILRAARPAAAAGALAIVAAGAVGVLLPELSPFGGEMPGLLGLFGAQASLVEAGIGVAALLVALLLGVLPRGLDRAAAGAVGVAAAITLPGAAIAGAGYLLALTVLVAVPVLLVVLSFRRPAVGIPLLAAVAAGLVAGELTGAFPVSGFLGVFLGGIGGAWLSLLVTFAHTFTGLALLALAVPESGTRTADAVRRVRVPVTIAAAACALPYVVARVSWLTPWPLVGPTREQLDSTPETFVTGLLLGTAMLVGAVLTLGLLLPWGSRFPRWVPRVGGLPVPVPLAVVPALLVALLFTVGGIAILDLGAAMEETGASVSRLTMFLVLPFWLWGPLLALAAWGYALHRRAGTAGARPAGAPTTRP